MLMQSSAYSLPNGIILQVGHLTIHSMDGHHTNFDLRRV